MIQYKFKDLAPRQLPRGPHRTSVSPFLRSTKDEVGHALKGSWFQSPLLFSVVRIHLWHSCCPAFSQSTDGGPSNGLPSLEMGLVGEVGHCRTGWTLGARVTLASAHSLSGRDGPAVLHNQSHCSADSSGGQCAAWTRNSADIDRDPVAINTSQAQTDGRLHDR